MFEKKKYEMPEADITVFDIDEIMSEDESIIDGGDIDVGE